MNRKAFFILLWILFSALAGSGCVSKYLTYEEMNEAYDTLPDGKAKKKMEKRIERFEQDAKRVSPFYESKAACGRSSAHVWFCVNLDTRRNQRRDSDIPPTIDEVVKTYRREKRACGCATQEQIRNLF